MSYFIEGAKPQDKLAAGKHRLKLQQKKGLILSFTLNLSRERLRRFTTLDNSLGKKSLLDSSVDRQDKTSVFRIFREMIKRCKAPCIKWLIHSSIDKISLVQPAELLPEVVDRKISTEANHQIAAS